MIRLIFVFALLLSKSIPVLAAQTYPPRFNYSESLDHYNHTLDSYLEDLILKSSKSELKTLRSNTIWGEKIFYGSQRNSAHVSAVFDVTSYLPEGFDIRKSFDHSSIISHLFKNISELHDNQLYLTPSIKVLSKSRFFDNPEHKNGHIFEKVDLFLNIQAFDHLHNMPELVDIDLMGVSRLVTRKGGPFRFLPNRSDYLIESNPIYLKSNPDKYGYYLEIKEAFLNTELLKIHVIFRNDMPISINSTLNKLNGHNIKVIGRTTKEAVLSLDEQAFDKLFWLNEVEIAKDIKFQNQIQRSNGRWRPEPLSTVEPTSLEQASFLIAEPIETNLHEQKHVIIESPEQLQQYVALLNKSPFNNKTKLVRILKDVVKFDFDEQNLVIVSHIEPSGSNSPIPCSPMWVNSELILPIDRSFPSRGSFSTADMAQYSIFYRISKDIPKLTVADNRKSQILANKFNNFSDTKRWINRELDLKHRSR